MPSLYSRMSALQSFGRQTSSDDESDTETDGSWIGMKPQFNTIIQALPNRKSMKNVVGEVDKTVLRYWSIVIAVSLFSFAITITPTIIVGRQADQDSSEYAFDCRPDGTVSLPFTYDYYNSWKISSLLDISLAFGNMSFPLAKLIDVIWDTAIGRGGQALLTVLLYRVLSQALLYSMETRRSSFRKFASVYFELGTLYGLCILIKDMYHDHQTRTIKSTLVTLGCIFSVAYVVAFPTMVSGISGYQAKSVAACDNPGDGSIFDATELKSVYYSIQDGSRVGLTDGHLCLQTWDDPFYGDHDDCANHYRDYLRIYSPDRDVPERGRNSSFGSDKRHTNLTSPLLDMMELYMASPRLYSHKDTIINETWLSDHMGCLPTTKYQWGFSLLGLFIWLVFTLVVSLILYSIWLQTFLHSRLDCNGRRLGMYKAIVDIATALREEFAEDCDTMSNEQFRTELKARDAGIKIDAEGLQEPRIRDMTGVNISKMFEKIGRYHAIKRERAASKPFEET